MNVVDRLFVQLPSAFNGFGMVIYVAIVLILSGSLSAIIGLERYRKGENAGMRTHALLSIGCSMLMIISIWAIGAAVTNPDYDISRIAAGAVTGIGFLGAGVIIKDKFTVKGLSTATTLWICAAIGLANGAGFILEGILATIITLLFIVVRNKLATKVDQNSPHIDIKCKTGYPALERVKAICDTHLLNLKNIDISAFND